jgi:hypothetical protein
VEIPVGYAQANFRFTGAGVPHGAEFTMGFDVSAYTGTISDAVDDIDNTIGSENIDNTWTDDVNLSSILLKYGPTATGPSVIKTTSHVGGQATSSAAPNTAVLLHKNTALGGRAGRGRLYVPGVPENSIDDAGVLAGAYVTARQAEWTSWLLLLSTIDLPCVVLHGANSPISTPTPLTALTLDGTVATQRRRLRR